MQYPAPFTPADEGGYVVTFRNIPEAIPQGDTLNEAMAMAADALATSLEFYADEQRPLPLASSIEPGEYAISPAAAIRKIDREPKK